VNDVTLSHNGTNGPESQKTLHFIDFAGGATRGKNAVYNCRFVCHRGEGTKSRATGITGKP